MVGENSCAGGTNYDYQPNVCRDKVRKVSDLFKKTLKNLQLEQNMKTNGQVKAGRKIYTAAAMQLKKRHPWVNVNKSLGAVPGVKFGNRFQ